MINWGVIQDVFLPHAQCSWARLRITHDPDQDNAKAKEQIR